MCSTGQKGNVTFWHGKRKYWAFKTRTIETWRAKPCLGLLNLSSQWLLSWREGNLAQAIAVPEENIYKNLGTSNNNERVWYGYYFTTRSSDVTNILSLSSPPCYMGVKPGPLKEGNTIPWGCSIVGSSRRYLGLGEDRGRNSRGLDRTAWRVCEASRILRCVSLNP